jgi:hypothetical protein
MGAAPSMLTVLPTPDHKGVVSPPLSLLATINDHVPLTNIKTFGMCMSPMNPAVQAATTAASGVFTPAPCIPAIAAPWAPPAKGVFINGIPAVSQEATCQCAWQGIVSVVSPGQIKASEF